MKEMVYKNRFSRGKTVLDKGFFKNYEYIILSLGTHPCAYVCIDSDNPFYKKHYDDIPIRVHGGLTFAEDKLHRVLEYSEKYKCDTLQLMQRDWIIGWDYGHYGDYNTMIDPTGTKHTTQEIKEEVKYAINQLIDLTSD